MLICLYGMHSPTHVSERECMSIRFHAKFLHGRNVVAGIGERGCMGINFLQASIGERGCMGINFLQAASMSVRECKGIKFLHGSAELVLSSKFGTCTDGLGDIS